MDKRNKWSKNTKYQRGILGVPFAIFKSAKEYKITFLPFLSNSIFTHKELEIIFANIRV